MRKFALALLLASAVPAAPALAAVQPEEESRAERSERSILAPGRARLNQPTGDSAEAPAERARRQSVMERLRERTRESRGANVESRGPGALRPVAPADSAEVEPSGDSVRDWRRGERRRAGSPATIEERNLRRAPPTSRSGEALVQPTRPLPPVLDQDRRRVSRTPVPGTEPPEPATASRWRDDDRHRWSHDWRRDRRYDWRDYRRRHRARFHLGFYFDPFGWRYHRYGIGWRLWPSYYSHRYWLHDPWMYRLPQAHGPYRWIRYYDDALLVNVYTGRVVDVIHNFFW
jgi:hypothetical protein